MQAHSRKKPGPAPTGKTPLIGVRLPPEITAALDRIVVGGDAFASRSDVIRVILREYLVANQLLGDGAK